MASRIEHDMGVKSNKKVAPKTNSGYNKKKVVSDSKKSAQALLKGFFEE